jgi:hypothetical protein
MAWWVVRRDVVKWREMGAYVHGVVVTGTAEGCQPPEEGDGFGGVGDGEVKVVAG